MLSGMSDLASNRARLAPNGTNMGIFKNSFLFILASCAKMNRKLFLKSPIFVPFGVNLALFEAIPDIPECDGPGFHSGCHIYKFFRDQSDYTERMPDDRFTDNGPVLLQIESLDNFESFLDYNVTIFLLNCS